MKPEKYNLKVTSGIAIGGVIYAPGSVARDVPEKLARELLSRGKVDLATEGDMAPVPAAELPEPEAVPASKQLPEPKSAPAKPTNKGNAK